MKTHEQIQVIINRTLEFIITHAETLDDKIMLKTAMEDYRDMGYDVSEFEEKYKNDLEIMNNMYPGDTD